MLTETAARCCVKEKENQKEGKKKNSAAHAKGSKVSLPNKK
jgi:hypothetical protein